MSSLDVEVKTFNQTLEVPTSKSYGNRLLILGALSKEEICIKNIPLSTDVETLIRCLKEIGLEIEVLDNQIKIKNSFPDCEPKNELDELLELETGDGGTTNRFLLGLLALGSRPYKMKMKGDMRSRPMFEMENALINSGCQVENNDGDIFIQGPIQAKAGVLPIDSSQSTQFITALKMIEPYASGIKFEPEGMETSQLYYEMTLSLIERMKKETTITIPVDFSSLGYPIAAGLTLGEVQISNCSEVDPFQADSILIKLVEKMGGDISFGSEGLKVTSKNELGPLDVDCGGFPDLVPTLAYLCSYAKGTSHLRNLEVLTYKESDRFEEIKKLLTLFEVDYSEDGYNLTIQGKKNSCGAKEYFPKPDHRMVMVGYLFMRKNSGGTLHHTEHVAKSYGNFFSQMG